MIQQIITLIKKLWHEDIKDRQPNVYIISKYAGKGRKNRN